MTNPYHTTIRDLDRQTSFLCHRLATVKRLEPTERIEIAQQLVMLQQDRAAMCAEIKTLPEAQQFLHRET